MDALDFFQLRYDNVHPGVWERATRSLSDSQIRTRPHPLVNTIAWQIWHLACCEDVGVNRLVVDRVQVLDGENWLPRLGVERRDIGTGMTDLEVDELSARIDLDVLRAYWSAISDRTLDVLDNLDSDHLTKAVDRARLDRIVAEEEMLGEHAGWVGPMWAKQRNVGWFLAQLALTHTTGHLYQIQTLRGLWGQRGPKWCIRQISGRIGHLVSGVPDAETSAGARVDRRRAQDD